MNKPFSRPKPVSGTDEIPELELHLGDVLPPDHNGSDAEWTGPATTPENDERAKAVLDKQRVASPIKEMPSYASLSYPHEGKPSLLDVIVNKIKTTDFTSAIKKAANDSLHVGQVGIAALSFKTKAIGDSLKKVGASVSEKTSATAASFKEGLHAMPEALSLGMSSAHSNLSDAKRSLVEKTKSGVSSLFEKVKNVGRSLKDPEVIKQIAGSAAVGIAVKLTVTASVGTGLGIAAGAGAAANVVIGNMRKEYNLQKASQKVEGAEPTPEIKGFFNKAAAIGKDVALFAAFSAKHVATGRIVQSLHSEWKDDKRAILKRAGLGAAGAVIGFGIGTGIHDAWGHLTSATPSAAIPAVAVDHTPVTEVTSNTHAPVVHAAPQVETPAPLSAADAQALKDEAVKLYNGTHGVAMDKDAALEKFREAAAAGNKQAIRDLAMIDGTHVTPQAATQPVAATPVVRPPLDLDLSDLSEPADIAPPVPVESLSTAEKIALGVGGAVGTTIAAGAGGNALLNNAFGEPVAPAQLRERAAIVEVVTTRPQFMIANTCRITDVPNQPQLFNVACPHTPVVADMRPGDALRVEYSNEANVTASEVVALGGTETVSTKSYEEALFNSDHFSGGVLARLRGVVAAMFNRSSATAEISVPAAQNDNGRMETSGSAPVLAAAAPR